MLESFTTPPSVLLVLHDVAPETLPDYQDFVAQVDALGQIPITWLVVPNFHRRNDVECSTPFQRFMQHRLSRGDELALHGYYHCDDGPSPRTPRDYFMRRVYTWEGEFYSLNTHQALTRLQAGVELFQRLDWPLQGFVAPAWLMSEGTRQALRQLPLAYTSDARHLYRLPDFSPVDAPGLVWSARSAVRRTLSKLVSDYRQTQFPQAPTLRLGLHPVDMRHESSRNYWLETLRRLMENGRVPMTKSQWLATQSATDKAVA
jgi:predicted deacetylase